MTITVIFASHRMGGKSEEIKKAMLRYQSDFNFDFIHLAKEKLRVVQTAASVRKKAIVF